MLGVKHGAKVSRYENRRRIPPLRTALAYATILDVPLPKLFPDLQKEVQAEVAGRSRQLQAKLAEARAGIDAGCTNRKVAETAPCPDKNKCSALMKPLFARRILALSVDWQSFGFVVFDGPDELMDWGTRNFRGGVNAVKIPLEAKLLLLLDANRPDALVLMKPKTRKRKMIVAKITTLARTQGIPVAFVSGTDVRNVFAPKNQSKYHIAAAVAASYPELLPRLPMARKPWQSERHGITIFEAAAVGFVYYGEKISPSES